MYRFAGLIALSLACNSSVWAAVLTVGPNGTYATLQAALNVAGNNGEDDEIRLQAGLLLTSAQASLAEDFRLEIIGGWNENFTSGISDPSATELNGNQFNQVLVLDITAGNVLVRNLTLAEGAATNGAGADITVGNDAVFELAQCRVIRNAVSGASTASGGGVRITVGGNATAEIDQCLFAQNQVQAATGSGGGLKVVGDDGTFIGGTLEFINNSVIGTNVARGGALALDIGGTDPSADFTRLTVRSNRVQSDGSTAGAGMHILGNASVSGPFFTIEAAEFLRNQRAGSGTSAAQFELEPVDGNFTLRSIAVLDGIATSGLRIDSRATAQVLVNNTTAAGNEIDGIRHEDGSTNTQSQYNVIALGNGGTDLVIGDDGNGNVLAFGNLSGADPGLIDPANGNYRLLSGSSAIDMCVNAPPGGLGNLDADFGERVIGGFVDCGAYEWSADNEDIVFDSSFETS